MKTFWRDPYLWIHAAGVAAVPLWLLVCLLGIAAGDPVVPSWLELIVVALVGIGPIVWMQWEKPFCIYSLLAVTLKPEKLTDDQRRILTLFKQRRNPLFIGLGAGIAFLLLKQMFDLSAIAQTVSPIGNHTFGLLIAMVAFLLTNLFLQVPLSVLQVLLTPQEGFNAAQPQEVGQIMQGFFEPGMKVDQILPRFTD
jgi:hypothetical protein